MLEDERIQGAAVIDVAHYVYILRRVSARTTVLRIARAHFRHVKSFASPPRLNYPLRDKTPDDCRLCTMMRRRTKGIRNKIRAKYTAA